MLFLLDVFSNSSDSRLIFRGFPTQMLSRRLANREDPPSVFEALRLSHLRVNTIRIKTDKKASPHELSSLAMAFLFQLAFNTDVALVPQRELDAYSRVGRISRMRRSRPSEIDPTVERPPSLTLRVT